MFTSSRRFAQGWLFIKIVKSEVEVLTERRRERALANQKGSEGPHQAMSLRAGLSALNTLNQCFCLRALYLPLSLVYSLLRRVVVCELTFSI